MNIGLDLDGTITENYHFFRELSNTWRSGKVYIITYRNSVNPVINILTSNMIRYDDIILAKSLNDKARIIKELNIKVYFDDQDECLYNIPEDVTVFKIRNEGNFSNQKWLYSRDTGRLV